MFPSIVGFETPIIWIKGPLTKFEHPLAGFDKPLISFDNPITSLESGLFDFDNPITSLEDPIISLGATGTKAAKLPSKAPATSDAMALGFMASPGVYVGPASMTAEGMLGLVAANGTLTEIGFGVLE